MKKKATIYILGTQYVDDDKDFIELTTEGEFVKKDGSFYLIYNEDELSGIKGSKTTIKIDGDRKAVIMKNGSSHSTLIIEPEKRNLCRYETEYGDILFGISDCDIFCQLGDDGGTAKLKYSLDVNSGLVSKNELDIKVRLN